MSLSMFLAAGATYLDSSQDGPDSLLTYFVFAPLVGMLIVLVTPAGRATLIKSVAVLLAAVSFVVGLHVLVNFSDVDGIQHWTKVQWIESFNIEYFVGVDGISAPMVFLSGLIGLIAVIASLGVEKHVKGYFALMLLLLAGMNGVFVSLDFFLFYVFWELMLLPMYFLIGIWGGPRRVYAAIKFFIFTMAGSVLMLIVLIACYHWSDGPPRERTADEIMDSNPAFHRAFAKVRLSSRDAMVRARIAEVDRDKQALGRYERYADYLIQRSVRSGGVGEVLDVSAEKRTAIRNCLNEWQKNQRLARESDASTSAGMGLAGVAQDSKVLLYKTAVEALLARPAKAEPLSTLKLGKTFDLLEIKNRWRNFSGVIQLFGYAVPFAIVMFVLLYVAFAIKVPVFPFHTWLPWAHVEAPTAVSVILAAILLKMGVYGFLRIAFPFFPQSAVYFAVPLAIFGVINII
jgi:NADH:ubiquinone oxidoreductase subunit 4 (subunit M)